MTFDATVYHYKAKLQSNLEISADGKLSKMRIFTVDGDVKNLITNVMDCDKVEMKTEWFTSTSPDIVERVWLAVCEAVDVMTPTLYELNYLREGGCWR
jgi:hypothetical protein